MHLYIFFIFGNICDVVLEISVLNPFANIYSADILYIGRKNSFVSLLTRDRDMNVRVKRWRYLMKKNMRFSKKKKKKLNRKNVNGVGAAHHQ